MTEPGPGHNDQLRSIVERIEAIEAEVKDRNKDKAEIYLEAKGNGYDVKALRTVVRMRRMDPDDRHEAESVLETYMHALGMI